MLRLIQTLLVACVAIGLCGCSNTTPTTPSTTNPATTTDTFSDTLNPNGAKTFTFAVAAAGTVTATITVLSPDSTAIVGLSLGTWNGSACQIVLANDNATQGTSVTGSTTTTGTLCARVYDVGKLTDVASFTMTVTHP